MRIACSVENRSCPAGHRRVRREHAFPPHHLNVRIRRRALRPAAQLALQQRQRQQRRVALVHVVHVNAQTQRMRHAHAAHPQHNLLLQAVVRVPAVKVIRQPAIPSGVFVQVGVQQINRHHVPELPLQVIPPCAQRHRAPFHCNRHPRRLFRAVVRRVPRLHFLGLRAIRVQMLLEIPLAVDAAKTPPAECPGLLPTATCPPPARQVRRSTWASPDGSRSPCEK